MIRVLHIAPSLDYGGIASVIMNYYGCMHTKDIQFDVLGILCPEAPRAQELEQMGGHYYFFSTFSNRHLLRHIITWTRFFREQHYDIIHAHCNLVSAWILLAARLAGTPVRIAHSHSTGLVWGGWIQELYVHVRQWILRCTATYCLACSKEAGEAMYGKHSVFHILPNGIDVNRYQVTNEQVKTLRKELHIDSKQTIYSMVARISKVKNHPFALEVFRFIHTIDPNTTLIIGGPSASNDPTEATCKTETILQEKIKAYHLEDAVRIVGARNDMAVLYALTDCWLFPSLYEGFPLGLLELQAAGTPTLVSDTVTKETDMGLNLLTFLSLTDSPEVWAQNATNKKHQNISVQTLQNAFKTHQLDIQTNAQTLYQLYSSLL